MFCALCLQNELDKIEVMVIEQNKNSGSLRDLLMNKASRRGLLTIVGLLIVQQFSGIAVISSYAQSIFDMVPRTILTSSQCAIVVGVIQVTFVYFNINNFFTYYLLFLHQILLDVLLIKLLELQFWLSY